MKFKHPILFLIVLLLLFTGFVWCQIIFDGPNKLAEAYFLDVGQGDSELVRLEGGVSILTDGGPDFKVVTELDKIFKSGSRYIDLVFVTHPQTDHFAGLVHMLSRYEVGAVIFNGRTSSAKEWEAFIGLIKTKKIPLLTVLAGDLISFRDSVISILSPTSEFLMSGEPNDGSVVEKIKTSKTSILLTGDITSRVEEYLLKKYSKEELEADILKVPHHGSKYSSTDNFIKAVNPKVAMIEVGEGNRYGHPAPNTLERLNSSGVLKIFRTDLDGTIRALGSESAINFFVEKR